MQSSLNESMHAWSSLYWYNVSVHIKLHSYPDTFSKKFCPTREVFLGYNVHPLNIDGIKTCTTRTPRYACIHGLLDATYNYT